MQFTQEQLSPCEVELRIEVEAERVKAAIDETYKELAKFTKVPGFRPGKAPKEVLERYVGEERVKERAADKIMQPAYAEALKEAGVEPWALADVDVVEFEIDAPMVFTAKVPLAPKVELGEYVGLEVERTVPPVTDDMIEHEIKEMLDRQGKFNPVTDREVRAGDTAVIDLGDEAEPDAEPKRQVVRVGDNLPDFDSGLTGMKIEEEKTIAVTYPEDHQAEEMRGKSASLKVKVVELFERELPELNDDWVKATFAPENPEGVEAQVESLGDAVDTTEKLRAKIREAMEKSAQDVADREMRDKIIEKVIENSQIDFPDVMVDERVDERVEELAEELKKRKLTVDDYLKHVGKTMEELREEFAADAKIGLKVNLVIYEIVEKEDIKVEDEDVEAEIASMSEARKVPVESIRAYLESTDGLAQIRYRLLRRKAMDFLVGASNIKNVG